jgi:hypothetical protein
MKFCMKFWRIDANATISDEMSSGAIGASLAQFIGKTIDLVYEVPDSDRGEVLVRFTDGTSIEVSCDPGYDEDLVRRTPEHWDVCVYDTTETEAGEALRHLPPGHWT